MKRNPLVFVFDIEAAIAGIIEATDGKTLDEFKADWLMRHGVQRGIEIISEATRHLRLDLLARYPEIAWPKVRAVGNVLRHEYQSISDDVIWSVVKDELPHLRAVMVLIRSELETGPG